VLGALDVLGELGGGLGDSVLGLSDLGLSGFCAWATVAARAVNRIADASVKRLSMILPNFDFI